MSIAFACPSCQEPYQLSTHLAGKLVRCRKCSEAVRVPAAADVPEEEAVPIVQAAETVDAVPAGGEASAPKRARPRPRRPRSAEREAPPPRRNILAWVVVGGFVCVLLAAVVVGGGLVLWLSLKEPRGSTVAKINPPPQPQPQPIPDKGPGQMPNPGKDQKIPDPVGPKQQPNLPPAKQEMLYATGLQNGVCVIKAKLDGTDHIDGGPRPARRKVYLVQFVEGRNYRILMESTEFDAYLRLEDLKGFELAADDDGAAPPPNLNAKIDFTPTKTAVYRVIARSCFPGEGGNFTLTIRDLASPAPAKEPANPAKIAIAVKRVDLPAEKLVEDLRWTPEGDAFFALTKDGVLNRVALKGLAVEKKAELGGPCGSLAWSGAGLVVALPESQEVCVCDPVTLAIVKRIPATGVQRALAAPTLPLAFAVGKDGVTVLDLAKGLTVNHFNKAPTQFAQVTPDGRTYFALGGVEQLCSYQIEGTELVEYQRTERIAQNGQRICVSPDSQYVCLPSAGGNYGTAYGTKIFAVDNFKTPVLTLLSGAYPRTVGFDPVGGRLFAQNAEKQLLVYTMPGGVKLGEFEVTSGKEDVVQFAVHPSGGPLLVLTDKSLQLVELKKAGGQ